MVLPPSKRFAMMAQHAPENHKYGFFIDPPLEKFASCTPVQFLQGIQLTFLFSNVEYWQDASFTFQFIGLQYVNHLMIYVEREAEFKLQDPHKLTRNDLARHLLYQIDRWILQNHMNNVSVKRLMISF